MEAELAELSKRLRELSKEVGSELWCALPQNERDIIYKQIVAMEDYEYWLSRRIKNKEKRK